MGVLVYTCNTEFQSLKQDSHKWEDTVRYIQDLCLKKQNKK